ncbi:MAG: hypothetical protein FWG42_07945 [Clostridiales bacterium]|nr:hypothetical protein [Clostridiales bacterium]
MLLWFVTSGFIAFIYDAFFNGSIWAYTIIFALSAIIIRLAINRYYKFRPIYPKIDCKYDVLQAEKSLEVEEEEAIGENGECIKVKKAIFMKKVRYRPLTDNLESIPNKYFWSGQSIDDIELLEPGYEKGDIEPLYGVWERFELKIKKAIKKGRPEVYAVKMDCRGDFVPFLGTGIDEPTKLLIMSVAFSKDMEAKIDKLMAHRKMHCN